MIDRPRVPAPFAFRTDLLYLVLLFLLGLGFFATVRDNTFWHSGDYLYLTLAHRIGGNWREIFSPAPHGIFQPLVNAVFYLEYRTFGTHAAGYYYFNILLHAVNAFLVHRVVSTLLKDRVIATLSALLFLFAVGNYGKAIMVVSGVGDLLITLLTLLTLLLYFHNELERRGRLLSLHFMLCVGSFALSLLTKSTSFSILGCMLAFNFFFRVETRRRLLTPSLIVVGAIAAAVLIAKHVFLTAVPAQVDLIPFNPVVFRNFGSYLVRMVFPIHGSGLVSQAGPIVRVIYRVATEIRIFTFLCIVSYTVFGFVFGNRAIRFFIAWTYITVAPFCLFRFPDDWLNIRYLYLVSVGFAMILASGTALAARLLYQKAWRRFLPYVVPISFVLLSQFIILQLDRNYEAKALSPPIVRVKQQFLAVRQGQSPQTP